MSIKEMSDKNKWFSSNFNIPCISETLENHKNHIGTRIAALSEEVNDLCFDDPCFLGVMNRVQKEVESDLLARKKTLEDRLKQLNGSTYGAPDSLIHQAHLHGLGTAKAALIAEKDGIEKELQQINSSLTRSKSIQSFLKLKTVEVKLHGLNGESCNGLLDKTWKTYQRGDSSREEYDRLEERRIKLQAKKLTLQPLCLGISLQDVNMSKTYFLNHFQQELTQASKAIAFLQGLDAWRNENCKEGQQKRTRVARIIFECYVQEQTSLDLSFEGLTSLPESVCQLVNLQKLDLQSNQLAILPESFGHLVNLRTLDVRRNQLLNLPQSFGQLVNLQILYLRTNRLATLPVSFEKLVNLQELSLDNNEFTALPESVCQLLNLQILYLKENQLRILPESFGQLVNLQKLHLGSNQIRILPESFGQLVNLQKLYLKENQLRILPVSFGRLVNLQKLHLGSNQLETLPESVCQLVNLQELFLGGNELTTLPESFGLLMNLRKLHLGYNRLATLPEGVCQLIQLERVSLGQNQLQTLPQSLGQLINLKTLCLTSNQLQAIPSCLARLSSRCSISADCNRLSYEAIQTFQRQIAHQRELNPNLGPNFQFSIFDRTSLTEDSSLQEITTYWMTQFRGNFQEGNVNDQGFSKEFFNFEKFQENPFYLPLLALDEVKTNHLKTFLIRLKKTKDFDHPSTCQPLVLNVAKMLHGVCTSEKFSEKLFLILEDALGTCGDRVANAFNMIHLQQQLLCGSSTSSLEKLASLLIGGRRIDIIEGYGRELIKHRNLGDAIEVLLFLKVGLQKMGLNLPVATAGMLYPGMSGVTPKDLENAKMIVLEKTSSPDQILEILLSSEEWKDRMIQENKALFQPIEDDAYKALENVFASSLNSGEQKKEAERLEKNRKNAVHQLILTLSQKWIHEVFLAAPK